MGSATVATLTVATFGCVMATASRMH